MAEQSTESQRVKAGNEKFPKHCMERGSFVNTLRYVKNFNNLGAIVNK